MTSWYYVEEGGAKGPVEDADLARLAAEGRLDPSSLVTPVGATAWSALSEHEEQLGLVRFGADSYVPRPSTAPIGLFSSETASFPVADLPVSRSTDRPGADTATAPGAFPYEPAAGWAKPAAPAPGPESAWPEPTQGGGPATQPTEEPAAEPANPWAAPTETPAAATTPAGQGEATVAGPWGAPQPSSETKPGDPAPSWGAPAAEPAPPSEPAPAPGATAPEPATGWGAPAPDPATTTSPWGAPQPSSDTKPGDPAPSWGAPGAEPAPAPGPGTTWGAPGGGAEPSPPAPGPVGTPPNWDQPAAPSPWPTNPADAAPAAPGPVGAPPGWGPPPGGQPPSGQPPSGQPPSGQPAGPWGGPPPGQPSGPTTAPGAPPWAAPAGPGGAAANPSAPWAQPAEQVPPNQWGGPPPSWAPPGQQPWGGPLPAPPGQGWGGFPPPPGYPAGGGPAAAGVGQEASWGLRLAAWLGDFVVLLIPTWLLLAAFGGLETVTEDSSAEFRYDGPGLFLVVALWVVYRGLLQGIKGQTLGKMLLGINVADANTGSLIGIGKALGREVVIAVLFLLCFIPLLLDLLSPLWDKRNQAWHDKIVGSVVLRGKPMAAAEQF